MHLPATMEDTGKLLSTEIQKTLPVYDKAHPLFWDQLLKTITTGRSLDITGKWILLPNLLKNMLQWTHASLPTKSCSVYKQWWVVNN